MRQNKYHFLIITNLAAFYKVRLFNEICRHKSVFVIFTGHQSKGRNTDFFNENALFPHMFLCGSLFNKCLSLIRLIRKIDYSEMIIGSWDHLTMWIAMLASKRGKTSLIVESSIYESCIKGPKAFLKKLFCSKISKVYVPGIAQRKLLENLNYEGVYRITHGVGIFNYHSQPKYKEKNDPVKRFLYVGRLTDVKNIEIVIDVFNKLVDLELYIVGFGELEEQLKNKASNNIIFLGEIENKKLSEVYQKMDVFILPSKSEPWGLVVEEALNNGLPIIASDRVGCKEDLVTTEYGIIFNHTDKRSLLTAISKIQNISYYNNLRKNISKINFEVIEKRQVEAYLN